MLPQDRQKEERNVLLLLIRALLLSHIGDFWRVGGGVNWRKFSSVAYMMFGKVRFLNVIAFSCCWLVENKFLLFISSSALKGSWNKSSLSLVLLMYFKHFF